MRLCIALTSYPPRFGGHGIQVRANLPSLRERGIQATILTETAEGFPALAHEDGVPIRRELSRGEGAGAKLNRILQFRRHFREHASEYDLLHVQMMGWELLANLPYVRRLGLPLVYEMVGLDSDDPVALARTRFGDFKLRRAQKYVDYWIGLTGVFRERIAAANIPLERFRVVYGGVDLDRFRPARGSLRSRLREELGLPGDARIVVSAGSVIPRKGMDRVLRAWAHVRPEAGRDLLLIIGPADWEPGLAGSWDPEHADLVRKLASAPEVDGTVRIVGRVENLHEYMSVSDVFVFLSHLEGLGYVTLEAMSCEVPCIVSPLNGIAEELISEGRTGYIAHDPDDSPAVAALISHLLRDASERQRIGEEARAAVRTRFSHCVRASALMEIYGELLARPR